MAVTVDELVLKITLSNEKTANQISKINDELKELKVNSAKTASGVSDFGASLTKLSVIGFAAVKAVEATVNAVQKIAGSYFEAADSVTRLNQALELSGSKAIAATSKRFQDLASEIQNLGIAEDEQIIALAKLGTAAGHSADRVDELIRAAADLAAAKEIPLEAAFKALSGTLKGSAIGLASFLPELKDMTQESMKAGDAIKYVGSQLGGYAGRNLETFSGKISALKFQSGEVLETIGMLADGIVDFTDKTNKSISAVQGLNEWLKENQATIVAVGKTIYSYMIDAWDISTKKINDWIGTFQAALGNLAVWLGKTQVAFDKFAKRSTALGESEIKFGEDLLEKAAKNKLAWENYTVGIEEAGAAIETQTNKNTQATKKFNLEIKSKEAEEAYKKNIEFLDKYYDALAQVAKQNADLQAQFNKGSGMNVQDQIASNLEAQTKEIDAQIEKYKQAYGVTSKIVGDLEKQKKLLAGIAAQELKKAPSKQYQALEKAGEEVADKISGVFTKGSLSIVGGAMSAVGLVVKAIDALLDFFPNFINSLAGVFNKLTDFPKVLFQAFQNLFDGVVRFVSEFAKNLIESVFKSIQQLKDFANNLSNAFAELVDSMPDLLASLVDALPDLVVGLAEAAVKSIMKIFLKGLEAMFLKLPIALWKALSKFAEGLKSVFSGKGWPKLKVDDAGVGKTINDAAKKLSENAGRIFKVEDLLEAAKNPLKKVQDDIIGSFQKGRDYLKEAWKWVQEKVIPLIVDSILLPFKLTWEAIKFAFDLIVTTVRALWDALVTIVQVAWSFVQMLWDNLKSVVETAWAFVQNLWDTLVTVVQAAWSFVQDLWDSLVNTVQGAFKFVKDLWDNLVNIVESAFKSPKALFEALKQTVEIAFKYVKDLWDNLSGTVTRAFTFVKTVFDSVGDLGGKIWQGLKDGLASAGSIFSNLGSSIWESLKSGLSGIGNFVMDIFNRLNPANLFEKIFKVDMKGKGTVENALNIDLPFLNFARGGMVPGQAKIVGDSLANDNILAMLSPGEAIIPRSRMNDPNIARIVQEILDGTLKLPQFAFGKGKFKIGGTIGNILSSGEKAAQDIGAAGQVVIDQATGIAQGAGDWLGDVFNDLNPLKDFWKTVEDKVFKDLLNSMFAGNRFAEGGIVPGSTDTVPAMLTPGEFVMSRPAVQQIGLDNLRAMNSGRSSSGGGDSYQVSIEINIDAKTTMDEGYIRGTLVPRMSEELKRASLDGKFVLSAKGIR